MDGGATLGRGQAVPIENYKKGARVWHRHPELVWISGELQHDLTFVSTSVSILLDDGQTVVHPLKSIDQLPFLRNPDILIGADDLTTLSYLHEPAVLHNVEFRFVEREAVYTYCGIVLVAVNPYTDCSHLYSDDIIQVYRGVGKQVRELDPHIYAVAEEAFYDLAEYGKNQSVIVSGESGAGKTVSAKFVMRYFASVANNRKGGPGIEQRVLASNPIMEAIGNAKTIRNDNSSRFGKYIQLNFGDKFAIAGAEMRTYLLEKSRLVFQARNERNYHIFYQMCAGREHKLLKGLRLDSADDYFYTGQGNASHLDGVNDSSEFTATLQALTEVGFTEEMQSELLRILAGILLLGDVHFTPGDEATAIKRECKTTVAQLCSEVYDIDENGLRQWLTNREIRAVNEVVRKPLDHNEAHRNRDALAKMIYAHTFNWVVDKVNSALRGVGSPQKGGSTRTHRFIGVLDIYGFETFQVNSFEQFCINYANEKLQQQFNRVVFKLEQEEYEREEISWVRIDFNDNQQCIDLIEARPGLIDYLDEQCKVVRGSDDGWHNQISNCDKLKKSEYLQLPKIRSASFLVKHFAAEVSYTVDGFLEKNKDTVNEQLMAVAAATKFALLREILEPCVGEAAMAAAAGGKRTKKTVASQFRDSLRDLMTVLESTRPHYVRCIKPNDNKERFSFEPKRAIQQLRACGVLETVRISAAGYPSRWAYDDFSKRYRVLYPEGRALWRENPRKFAQAACTKHLEDEKFALGKTKIFFRTGQVALLERKRTETLSASAIKIQTAFRGFIARKRYQKIREGIRTIQAAGRAFMVYRRLHYLQMHRAVVTIQTAWRRHKCERRFTSLRSAVIAIQAAFRGRRVRREVMKLRFEKSAVTIQRYWRGFLVRRDEIKRKLNIIKVQSYVRRWLAKRRLKELKIEARSVGHLQKLNSGLENKIIELQQKLDISNGECSRLSSMTAELHVLKVELGERKEQNNVRVGSLQTRIEELEADVERLQMDIVIKDEEKQAVEKNLQYLIIDHDKKKGEMERRLSEMEDRAQKAEKEKEELDVKTRQLEGSLNKECDSRVRAESEMAAMREQLLANATLLASPALSRHSSFRGDPRGSMRLSPTASSLHAAAAALVAEAPEGSGSIDELALLMRQQRMISELSSKVTQFCRENQRLKDIMDANALIESLDRRTSLRAFDAHRMQELEMAYSKLKGDLEKILANRPDTDDMKAFIDRILEENDTIRDESIELRAMLTNRFERQSTHGPSSSPRPDSGHWSATHSDDGSTDLDEELCLERQCRQLKAHIETLTRAVSERDVEIEKLENRLASGAPPVIKYSETSTEESIKSLHGQLNHLVSENLSLNEKILRQQDELSETRGQLRGYTGGLGFSLDNTSDSEIIRLETLSKENTEHSALLEVFNVPEFSRILVCDLKPRLARLITKCFPSYVLLATFRYYDHAKDEASLTGLFNTVHIMLKDTLTHSHDMDVLSLWLVNTWRLFNLLRQYSGEAVEQEWHASNTEKQNGQRMQSFDVDPIRRQLSSRVEDAYQSFMKTAIEPVLSAKIVPGLLQHESSGDMMNGETKKAGQPPSKALDDLIELLNFIHAKLSVYGADSVLIGQVFGQISSWMCALALNYLMFRKDLCNFEKAIQIKHNVTELQSWLYKKQLGAYREELEPLVQASHLLQSKKDEANIETLCGEMTSRLKPRQVVAILQHYAPSDGFEERCLDADFLVKVQKKLNERRPMDGETDPNGLIMPGTYLKPFDTRPFVYSEFPLETLTLPSCLRLQQVSRLL